MLASRMSRIAPSPTLRVTAEADRLRRQGVDVVDLGAGEPDFATPEHIKQAARDAIDRNFTKYTPSAGVMELREAICHRYQEDYGVTFQPEQTIVTAGAKQALYNAAIALFEEGDEVITHAPYWPTIPEQVKLAGATPVIVHTHAEDGFTIHAEPVIHAITARTKGIIINSPCNPTGALISENAMIAIADAAAKRGIWVVADVTYERLVYDSHPHNLVRILVDRLADRTVICSATSKAYAMTGWRCGWAIAPAKAITAFNAVQGHSTSNVASITQKAAVAALAGPQDSVVAMRQEYLARRDRVWEWLTHDPRFVCVKPKGAFYLFPYVADVLESTGIRTSAELAEALLNDARVALTAGEGFDAPGYLRLSYATSLDRLREGVTRIHEFVNRRSAIRGGAETAEATPSADRRTAPS
jgi:aspartate aminotransferase